MKKFLAFILSILYMGSSTGATFHIHYCMDELKEVRLWHGKALKCDTCKAAKSSCSRKCCRDEHKTVKLEKDQKATENSLHFMQAAAIPVSPAYDWHARQQPVSLTEAYPVSNAPPHKGKVHPHILFCTFLI
jgi:hypothetical protein